MAEIENNRTEITNEGCDSPYYQRVLDLEAYGFMGITPAEKYQREVGVVFDKDKGGFSEKLPNDARILDVACGSGDSSAIILESNPAYRLDAVDISSTAIARANEKHADSGVRFQVGNMMRPPTPNKPYDAVTCLGRAFAYFKTYPEYVEALRNWNSALKEGGQVAIEWTEWSDGKDPEAPFQSINGVSVSSGSKKILSDEKTGDAIKYPQKPDEVFEYPGEQLPHSVGIRRDSRIYVDSQGMEHQIGSENDFFLDLLRKRNMPLIQRMLEEAGFEKVRLVEDKKPLTHPDNPKQCTVMTVIGEKPMGQTAEGIATTVRDRIGQVT